MGALMIAHASEEPLQRITLNLFRKDWLEFKAIYGEGYQGKIRSLVRDHLRERRRYKAEVAALQGARE
jgi:hypothetical protein